MRPAPSTLLLVTVLAALPRAQDEVLIYKFDDGGGPKVINFAPPASPAPREATVRSTEIPGFAPGRFGFTAMKGSGGGTGGHTVLDTGWNGAFRGSFSVAFWLRQRTQHRSTLPNYFFYGSETGNATFRGFTGGIAGNGLKVRGASPANFDLTLTHDVQSAAAARWVHLALVVDGTTRLATFYVDGTPQPAIGLPDVPDVSAGTGSFLVGGNPLLDFSSGYDLDDFRFVLRAVSLLQVRTWALRSEARDAAFGTGCGATLTSSGGAPNLGSTTYTLNITGAPSANAVLSFGLSRLALPPVLLPFDLGAIDPRLAGCLWHSSADAVLPARLTASGTLNLLTRLPDDVNLLDVSVYVQAMLLGGTTLQVTNPFAISLGR